MTPEKEQGGRMELVNDLYLFFSKFLQGGDEEGRWIICRNVADFILADRKEREEGLRRELNDTNERLDMAVRELEGARAKEHCCQDCPQDISYKNLEKENADLRSQLNVEKGKMQIIVRAIKDEGLEPEYHREVMAHHKKEWPTLWKAIAEIAAEGEPRPIGRGGEEKKP